ncbi:MAG: 23S rRNA (pseudouridine(1915)-N(3))-methyltransferase RlmH [Chitinophagales bacterium]
MKLQIWSVGKQHEPYIREGAELFTRRISNYFPVEWNLIASPKNAGQMQEEALRASEASAILQLLKKEDQLVALDEQGASTNSPGLARFIQTKANEGTRNLVFLIGGAYGLDEKVLQRATFKWSLSALTFPHQLVRLILTEQLYRACTIIRNEKYHHA